jgi:hypothetical protein
MDDEEWVLIKGHFYVLAMPKLAYIERYERPRYILLADRLTKEQAKAMQKLAETVKD